MFDLHASLPVVPSAAALWPPPALPASDDRHEAPGPAPQQGHWLVRVLDEIDYGTVLLAEGGRVLHINHAARAELEGGLPLRLQDGRLQVRQAQDAPLLQAALQAAQRGLRRLLTLGEHDPPFTAAVVPLGPLALGAPKATLLLLGKRHVCESLSVQWFARSHALTPAETRVLEALCGGLEPREVAARHGVGLATVRTQIGAIRAKTGAPSIRDLVRRVAVLPPMVSSLRAAA